MSADTFEKAIPFQISRRKALRLREELSYAIRHTGREDFNNYGRHLAVGGGRLIARRYTNVHGLVSRVYNGSRDFASSLASAHRDGRKKQFFEGSWHSLRDRTSKRMDTVQTLASEFGRGFRDRPTLQAGKLGIFVLGLLTTSGGISGDGGLPDKDWQIFEQHRSIWTHSVTLGIGLEFAILSFLYVVKTVYPNLPPGHDPFWESLIEVSDELAYSLTAGLSLGLAYHLGVDATIDGGGTYADLPMPLPQEGHVGVAMTNAIAEGLHAGRKMRDGGYVFIDQEFSTWADATAYARANPGAIVVRGESGFQIKSRNY